MSTLRGGLNSYIYSERANHSQAHIYPGTDRQQRKHRDGYHGSDDIGALVFVRLIISGEVRA